MSNALENIAPEGWPRGGGYSHGMAGRGRIVYVAGQIGWDPLTQRVTSDDFATQVAQALDNVVAVLAAAGASPQHTARMTWYIADRAAYVASLREIGQSWRDRFGRHYPAMSVVIVSALLERGALVEIEATALVPE